MTAESKGTDFFKRAGEGYNKSNRPKKMEITAKSLGPSRTEIELVKKVRQTARAAVEEGFRKRDPKTWKQAGVKSQYNPETMEQAFADVDAMMKAKGGQGRIGKALKSVYEKRHLYKIEFEAFRRSYYRSKKRK